MSKSMEGWVEKKANKWRKYYAVMVGNRMYFFKNEKTDDNDQMVGHLEISNADAVKPEETKKKYCTFSVASQTGCYHIKVSSEEVRDRWMEAIRLASGARGAADTRDRAAPPPLPGGHPSVRSNSSSRPLPPPPSGSSPSRLSSTTSSIADDTRDEVPYKVEPPDGTPFSEASWHFGSTSRNMAEKLLQRHGSEGSFLLRASESTRNNYSLSVMDGKSPRHYKILPQPGGGFILTGCADKIFEDLSKLVDYYVEASKGRSNPLNKFNVEKMEIAFTGPAKVVQGAVLPGMMMAMQDGMR